jgi:hypothetical protein
MAQPLNNKGFEPDNLEPKTLQLIDDINTLISTNPRPYIYIGEKLCELKKLLGHGNLQIYFSKYIIGVRTPRACEQWMKGYRKLAKARENLEFKGYLNFRKLSITHEALEFLSRETTNEQCIQVLIFAQKGESITKKVVEQIITPSKWVKEKQIQEAKERELSAQGISLLSRRCQAGQADIVTKDTVYEVKRVLTKENIFRAIGQVLLYRECINPSANAVIVGIDGGIKDLIPFINQLGVKVELIE